MKLPQEKSSAGKLVNILKLVKAKLITTSTQVEFKLERN